MSTVLNHAISVEERARREREVAFARGSVRFEGFVLDSTTESLDTRYINGEMTSEEHVQAVLAHARGESR